MTVWYARWNEPTGRLDTLPYRVTYTKCRTDSFISPDDGHSCPKHVQKINKYTKKNCAPSWLYLQDYTVKHGQQNIKFFITVLTLNVMADL